MCAAIGAASLAACGGGGSGAPSGATTASPSGSGSAEAPAPVAHTPRQGTGSAVALSADGKRVFVAGEVQDAVFVAPVSFADLSAVRVVPMPGPPAQIVVANDLVLATVRTLPTGDAKAAREAVRGPLPDASKARRLASGPLGDSYGSYKLPEEWQKHLEDAPLDPPEPAASASASAGPGGKPPAGAQGGKPYGSASAGKPDNGPPASASALASASAQPGASAKPGAPKIGTPPRPYDPSIVRKSQGGLLVILRPDPERGLVELGRVVLPPDAWGLAVTPDGKRAVVTSAWSATVSVVDVDERKVIASLPVAREPRGVTLTKDGKTAYVSHLVGSDLTKIEDVGGAPRAAVVPLPAGRSRAPEKGTTTGSLGWSLVLSPDDGTLFVPRHAIGAEGQDAWWGAPVIDILDVKSEKPMLPPRRPKSPVARAGDKQFWAQEGGWGMLGDAPQIAEALVQPRAVVYRARKGTLLIAGEGRSLLVEADARAADPTMFPFRERSLAIHDRLGRQAVRGGAPSAIALSEDENTAYVYCRTTFDLAKIDLETNRAEWLRLAEDGLPEDARRGRILFADAEDSTISGGLGCETCHPEGRDDGYVWREVVLDADSEEDDARFIGLRENMKQSPFHRGEPEPRHAYYPRQTPMIAGRARAKGPYGWHAEADTIVERLERGFRLHRAPWDHMQKPELGTYRQWYLIDTIGDYLQSGLLPPPTLDRPLTDVEKRGKALFESAEVQCSRCHVPDTELTDRTAYPLRALPVLPGFDAEKNAGFKTPSLYFIAGTPPYFHDGSQATLEDLVKNNGSRMGQTGQLGAEDQAALVAYLRTL